MRLRVQTDQFTTLLLAALGLAPIGACGGAFATNTGGDSGGSGQASSGSGGDGLPGTGGDVAGGLVEQGGGFVGQGGASSGVGGDVISGTGGGGFSNGTGGGATIVNPFPCLPEINGDASYPNGYLPCQNGLLHRVRKQECPSYLPRAEVFSTDGGIGTTCQRDTDCVAQPHGSCGYIDSFGGPRTLGPQCSYGCVSDEECGTNAICVCGYPVGHCESATCSVDSQCGPGLACASYVPNPGCPGESFACQTPVDQCAVDADCKVLGGHCTYQQNHRVCSTVQCAVGRPFLVDGAARLAPRAAGNAWQMIRTRPSVAHVSIEYRARLAEEWTRIGLMEHASIAAFARFTLQLMSLGAPADLIERSNAATADETLHAKLAFSIASSYAGHDVGPGRLDMRGALDGGSLREILVNVIREGCIGETIAAVDAAEALEHAVDPVIRAALTRIAHDELRHADLAWQFVRWALESGDEDLHDVVQREFEASRGPSAWPAHVQTDGVDDEHLLAGGILPPGLKGEVHATTMERVVLVCARALLESLALRAAS